MQVFIAVGQKAHFQAFDERLHIAGTTQQAGYNHERAGVGGNACGVVQAGKERRFHGQGDQPVHQADSQAAGGQQYR
ncbi:hypothetical protein D3C79_928720 [compost metagenome]